MENIYFKTKKDLAKALINGDMFRVVGSPDNQYCFFTEDSEQLGVEGYNPFKYGVIENTTDCADLDGWWSCCDGETAWEKVA